MINLKSLGPQRRQQKILAGLSDVFLLLNWGNDLYPVLQILERFRILIDHCPADCEKFLGSL
jgi:hypothetical protein